MPRAVSIVMTVLIGLLFGVSLLLKFQVTLPFLVLAPFILYFPFSYMAYSAFQRPVRIKRLRSDFELLTAQWDEALYQQSTSFFNYMLHIMLAVLVTLLGLLILAMPASSTISTEIRSIIDVPDSILRAMSFGFLGSLLFSFYYVYRRYTTSDLLPAVYLYCAITMLLGMIFNYIAFQTFSGMSTSGTVDTTGQGVVSGMIDLMSFAVGFFPILAISWFTQMVYKAFGQRQRRSDLFPLDQLDGISQSQELRLRDFGIDDAQNLASTEIPLLLIHTSFPVQTVVDWVDQAVLMVLLNNMSTFDSFRKAHIRTMTDFRDLWEPYVRKHQRLTQERDTLTDVAKELDITKKIGILKEEQTEVANTLNSNIGLLNALYSSTNFDMNIHYLNNYRKNVELLLPGLASARYNRYLLEAYTLPANNSYNEQKELARLWHFVDEYLQVNELINKAREKNLDDGSHGVIVEPTSVEARMGLARLYAHRANECPNDQTEVENYKKLAEKEYRRAFNQGLFAVTQIGKDKPRIYSEEAAWAQAASQAAAAAAEAQEAANKAQEEADKAQVAADKAKAAAAQG
jgi:hypothetical protein